MALITRPRIGGSTHMPNIVENTTTKIEVIVNSGVHMVGNHVQNKMLFVDNLPPASTTEMLTMLFQQFTGFIAVRMVHARPGIAFVDFETPAYAAVARSGLDNF